jgi:Zn-dependent protease
VTISSFTTLCASCSADIAPGLLACPGCARLLYATELAELARTAEAAERTGDRTGALGAWRRAVELLPADTLQRAEIDKRMRALTAAIDGRGKTGSRTAGAAAGVGAVGLALVKSKALIALLFGNAKLLLLGLMKLPTLLSMLLYVQWSSGRGAGFGIGLVASIYVHEVGHVAALRRYGIEASPPMFVPGFGAFVRMKQYPTDAHEEARTGLAGPLWGLAAAIVAAAIGALADSPVALAVASIGATINMFNLVPFWQLDGARGLRALSRGERFVLAAVALVTAIAFHQWMPSIVAVLAFARAFGKEAPPTGDRRMLLLFAALVVAHGAIAMLPAGAIANG